MTDERLLQTAREDGTTSKQMTEAPYGATFVIHNMRGLRYFQTLATFLGRGDLVFVSVAAFSPGSLYRARDNYAVVVDHYADGVATSYQREAIRLAQLTGPKS